MSVRLQDQAVRMTQEALSDLIRAVEALPEEKRDWKPAESARSALDQLREVALSPQFHRSILVTSQPPAPELHAQLGQQAAQLIDLESCRAAALQATSDLCGAISQVPDAWLEREVTLPFKRAMTVSLADVCFLHYWNTVYHLGQVNYLQTLLGDREMH